MEKNKHKIKLTPTYFSGYAFKSEQYYKNMIFLTFSTELGSDLITDGKLYAASSNDNTEKALLASELHMRFKELNSKNVCKIM